MDINYTSFTIESAQGGHRIRTPYTNPGLLPVDAQTACTIRDMLWCAYRNGQKSVQLAIKGALGL